jgi:hypothetical protein
MPVNVKTLSQEERLEMKEKFKKELDTVVGKAPPVKKATFKEDSEEVTPKG